MRKSGESKDVHKYLLRTQHCMRPAFKAEWCKDKLDNNDTELCICQIISEEMYTVLFLALSVSPGGKITCCMEKWKEIGNNKPEKEEQSRGPHAPLLATSRAVEKFQLFHKSTNKGTIPNWTSKHGGCKMRKEIGKLTKFYCTKSSWWRSNRMDLFLWQKKRKTRPVKKLTTFSNSN